MVIGTVQRRHLGVLLLLCTAQYVLSQPDVPTGEETSLDALMPAFETDGEDAYLCTAVALPDKPLKLISITPKASMEVVHHMLLFGCSAPASREKVWNCHMSSPCSGETDTVLYGWGKNAPAMHLPAGVGYAVGPQTGIQVVVLQVHYLLKRPAGDASGVQLQLTSKLVEYSAGMLNYASMFTIPPKTLSTKINCRCCYSGFEPLHPFAFRVHTHALGRSVYLERVEGEAEAVQVAEKDPQLPQGFYPVQPGLPPFFPGDLLSTTCDFNSSEKDTPTSAGSHRTDEMCNLYMMVYSQMPFFVGCLDSNPYVSDSGPGGIPAAASLQPEQLSHWQPPPPVSASAKSDGSHMGQVSGVVKANDGSLWVLTRGDRVWDQNSYQGGDGERITYADPISGPTVLHLEADSGKVLGSWGDGLFFMPHSISTDRQDNLWVTDTGLHQAIKFSATGEKLLEIGERLVPGHDESHLCKPTAVAVTKNGDIFISDGYCNSRVVQYDAKGNYLGQFTLPDGQVQMNVPHSVVVEECSGALYVADRESSKVHRFRLQDRQLAATFDLGERGPVYGLALGPYGTLLALAWNREAGETWLVHLDTTSGAQRAAWRADGVETPHNLALGAAPLRITGAGEPLLAAYISETRPQGSGLRKFILLPDGRAMPEDNATQQQPAAKENEGAAAAAPLIAALQVEAPQPSAEQAAAASPDLSLPGGEGATPVHHQQQEVDQPAPEQAPVDSAPNHVISQDLSAPADIEYDNSRFDATVNKIFKVGVPLAAVFIAVAAFMWWKLGGLDFDFQRLPTHESAS